jgi:hypothetical protein
MKKAGTRLINQESADVDDNMSHLICMLPLSSSIDEDNSLVGSTQYDSMKDVEVSDLENEDLKWVLNQLAHWNLEHLIGEVVYNIFSAKFVFVRKNRGIRHWDMDQLKSWLSSLSFLSAQRSAIIHCVEEECIDGDSFTILYHESKLGNVLGIDYVRCLVLELILTSWQEALSDFVLPNSIPLHMLGNMNLLSRTS